MTRFVQGWITGRTLHGKARTNADVYIESNITITETPAGKGMYHGDTAVALNPGDYVACYDILSSDIQPCGFAEFEADTSNIALISAKIDSEVTILKSDIASGNTKADSDMVILKSDVILVVANTSSDATIIGSDLTTALGKMNSAISDLALIYDRIRNTTHEYHLDD